MKYFLEALSGDKLNDKDAMEAEALGALADADYIRACNAKP